MIPNAPRPDPSPEPGPSAGALEHLAWVQGEIHSSLAEAVSALKAFLGGKDDTARLRLGRDLLHQVAGALRLLELPGGALLIEAAEQVFARWDTHPDECLPAAVRSVESALVAVRAWVDAVAAGARPAPMRLYPRYRDLLTLVRAPRIHPADLLFPDLSRRTPYARIAGDGPIDLDRLRVARVRFEAGLLELLRSPDDPHARRALCDSVAEIELLPHRGLARAFWWSVRGLFEALNAFALPVDEELKRFLARLNQQLRRQIENGPAVSERLFIDALFHVSCATEGVERADAVRRFYHLDQLAPRDFADERGGAPDPLARRTGLDALRQAQVLWGQLAAAGHTDFARLAAETARAAESAGRLGLDAGARLLQVVGSAGVDAASYMPETLEAVSMEVATALLLLESRIDDLARPDERFDERAAILIERIGRAARDLTQGPAEDWITEIARQAHSRGSLGAVVSETRGALHEIELRLDRFFRNPADRRDLAALPPLFDQIGGVLGVLGFGDAEAALRHVQAWVRHQADPASVAEREAFDGIAQSMGALGFFLSSLEQNPVPREGIFHFDARSGLFTASLGHFEPAPGAEDEPQEAAAADVVPAATAATAAAATTADAGASVQAADVATAATEATASAALAATAGEGAAGATDVAEDAAADAAAQIPADGAGTAASAPAIAGPDANVDGVAGAALAADEPQATDAAAAPAGTDLAPSTPADFAEASVTHIEALPAPDETIEVGAAGDSFDADELGGDEFAPDEFDEDHADDGFEPTQASAPRLDVDLSALGLPSLELPAAARSRDGVPVPEDAPTLSLEQRFASTPPAREPSPEAVPEHLERSTARLLETVLECANGLVAKPDDAIIRARLSPVLHQLMADAELLDDAALRDRAQRALALLAEMRRGEDVQAALALRDLFRPATPPRPALPTSVQEADRELLEVFVEEADEILESIGRQLARLRIDPTDGALLTMTRRAFHTLKGSSRMVGLDAFGNLAWAVEQCCNVRLAQERPADEDLLQVASYCGDRMRDWIEALRVAGPDQPGPDFDATGLIEAAHAVRDGEHFQLASRAAGPAPAPGAEPQPAPAAPAAPLAPEPSRMPPSRLRDPAPEDETVRIGPITISHGLYTVFLGEADECSRALVQDVGEWRYEPNRPVQPTLVRRAHTLAGISLTVGLEPLVAIAEPLDLLFQHLHAQSEEGRQDGPALLPSQFDVLERALERVRGMLHQFAAGILPEAAPLEAGALQDLLLVLRAQDGARGTETPGVSDEVDPHLLQIFTIEAGELLPEIGAGLRALASDPAQRGVARELMRQLHTLKGSARMAGAMRLGELVHAMETRIEPAMQQAAVTVDLVEQLQGQYDDVLTLFEQLSGGKPLFEQQAVALTGQPEPQEQGLRPPAFVLRPVAPPKDPEPAGEPARLQTSSNDASTMPPGPAPDATPASGTGLNGAVGSQDSQRAIPAEPADAAASETSEAPQAGAATTPAAASLAAGAPGAAPSPAAALAPSVAADAEAKASGEVAAPPIRPDEHRPPGSLGTAAFIRVRADVVDRLVDHAGEIAIARSRAETGMGSIRGAVGDLAENVQRLRSQLRELELQAQTQLQGRGDAAPGRESEFDPLEFDRYTRLQELSRHLQETVEDIALVQGGMTRMLLSAEQDLTAQSRLTRELQQQLMRVRLVPFGNIAERLHRVVRQAARELGKRVQLDLRGSATEIDRGVLEQMAGAFEHLVRNGVVHGIEAPERRAATGKGEAGEIRIEVRHEGNEVVVTVADDGSGLDYERLRERCIEGGLLAPGAVASERELSELMFAPGISTAGEITELAGRGVGLDVVREQVNAVGGRISVSANPGQGTRFTLYLPMSLSILQVVLAHSGGQRFAVPAAMIEQIRRVRPAALHDALVRGSLDFEGPGEITLRALAQLLGQPVTMAPGHNHSVALLRVGDDRLAISIDELSANQEVVVKPVGAQVARLPGILGATVLGDGHVVLIINPLQMLVHAPEPSLAAPGSQAPGTDATAAGPLVLVVDDSLTVRRVTQRLLERNGMRVTTAKDGMEALRELSEERPDVMLVDVEMPRMDGYDLTRSVRANPQLRDIPILMITSRTAEKHRRVALELGVDEYLGKPWREEELLDLVRRYASQGRGTPS